MRKNTIGVFITLVAVSAALMARQMGGPLVAGVPVYRVQGPSKAPVTIVAFSDFQCPNCAKAEPVLKDLLARHPGKIRLFFRHHPLRMHPWSRAAARAAEAAGLQGRFWEYHDVLFQRQLDWSPAEEEPRSLFIAYARELGLDADRFAADLADPKWAGLLEADERSGAEAAVNATPTFFINGQRRVGSAQLSSDGERLVELGGG